MIGFRRRRPLAQRGMPPAGVVLHPPLFDHDPRLLQGIRIEKTTRQAVLRWHRLPRVDESLKLVELRGLEPLTPRLPGFPEEPQREQSRVSGSKKWGMLVAA